MENRRDHPGRGQERNSGRENYYFSIVFQIRSKSESDDAMS